MSDMDIGDGRFFQGRGIRPNPPSPFPERAGSKGKTPISFQGRGWGEGFA